MMRPVNANMPQDDCMWLQDSCGSGAWKGSLAFPYRIRALDCLGSLCPCSQPPRQQRRASGAESYSSCYSYLAYRSSPCAVKTRFRPETVLPQWLFPAKAVRRPPPPPTCTRATIMRGTATRRFVPGLYRPTRPASPAVVPERVPSLTSAWRTQPRRVLRAHPQLLGDPWDRA